MSNFEKHEGDAGHAEVVGPDKLTIDDIARLLGASVVIPVSSPWESLEVYSQRQIDIRNQSQNETEA